jgi:hypothetical protein
MLWSSGEVEGRAEDKDTDALRERDCTSKGVLGTCGEGEGVLIGEGASVTDGAHGEEVAEEAMGDEGSVTNSEDMSSSMSRTPAGSG